MAYTWYIEDGLIHRFEKPGLATVTLEDGQTELVIPEGVTEISKGTFYGCTQLSSINLPQSVTRIASGAFFKCSSLTDIVIPEGVTVIEDIVFDGCESLKYINLPQSVTRIGKCAFQNCSNLTSSVIPEGMTVIENYTFSGCTSLKCITLPQGITKIGKCAFQDCFSLPDIMLPVTLVEVAEEAFAGCTSLKSIALSDHLTTIGWLAFPNVRHVYANIWNNACHNQLPDEVLIHTNDLTDVPTQRRLWAAIAFCEDGRSFDDAVGQTYAKYLKTKGAKIIPVAMQHPAVMQALLRGKLIAAKDIDAFHDAAREQGDTELTAQLLAYQTDVLTTSKVAKTRAKKAAEREKKLEQVVDRAIARAEKKDLVGLVFVVTGKLETFKARSELKSLLEGYGAKLAASVTAKTDYLVTNDTSSDSEKIRKAAEFGVDVIDEKRLNELLYRQLTDAVEVVIPEWIKVIRENAFWGCKNLTSICLPDGVSKIENYAFGQCESLKEINIPQSVTRIGPSAFYNCRNLTSIIIPEGMTVIEEHTFSGCKSLKEIDIPEGVTKIEWCAFYGCKNLTGIRIPNSVKEIDESAFGGCNNLTIYAPAGSYAETFAKKEKICFVAL